MSNYQNDGAATLNNQSNLSNDAVGFSYRDVNAEKGDRLQKATSFIPDSEMRDNPNNVIRDGMHIHADGELRPNDVVNIGGMEMTVEMARQMGALSVTQAQPTLPQYERTPSAQAEFYANAENVEEIEPQALQDIDLLRGQLDMATQGSGEVTLNEFVGDFIEHGELTPDSIEKARMLGFSEDQISEQYAMIRNVGSKALYDVLENGDGLGADRVELLSQVYQSGTSEDARLVSQLIAGAALGHLSEAEIIHHFDRIANRY